MRRLLLLMLAVLLLAGCAKEAPPPETTEPVQTTVPPTVPGLYQPESALEQQTQGAVRCYGLPQTDCYDICAIGDRILVASGTDTTTLTLLTGDTCIPTETTQLPVYLAQPDRHVTFQGVSWYDGQNRQAVLLDTQLQEYNRILLPEDTVGAPVFSPDGGEIFYCVPGQLRGMDVQQGISRLIKDHGSQEPSLVGCYFDGTLVQLLTQKGEVQTPLYISTENGQTLSQDTGLQQLSTYEQQYLALRMDGVTPQWLISGPEGSTLQLHTQGQVYPALELGYAVEALTTQDDQLQLSCYRLESGLRTSQLTLSGALTDLWADRWSGCIWLLITQQEGQSLLRWDPGKTPLEDAQNYTGPVFTPEAPDEEGLKQLQDRVDGLNREHGVIIRIWKAAVKTPGGHVLVAEHQTSAISNQLDRVEALLAQFPENFLYRSVNSKIRICIVRSVDGAEAPVRYWDDGDAFQILPTGAQPEQWFLHQLGYLVDSHILGNSPLLDGWEALNPEGFAYGDDPQAYLSGDAQAFVDAQSAAGAVDDRAEIFRQAMLPDNAELFRAPAMQAKLHLLCTAIRDAWRLEKKTEVYPWEQYLQESIAYVAQE